MTAAAELEMGDWDPEVQSWFVKQTENWRVHVIPMIFNHRVVVMTEDDYPNGYSAGWCYDKGGIAMLAAAIWDPETESDPQGFKKKACDAR